ncbi:replication initiation negative regulator SeqA [Arsukibacterium sp.]|uniref:replication initiation negative regulator SeqA n=1 Tax=Arsukibacterium sp. TaxID=1977258 RepID=UPI002FD9EA26
MKTIEIDDDLYHYIAGQTQQIGESASDILRRLLLPADGQTTINKVLKTEPALSSDKVDQDVAVQTTAQKPAQTAEQATETYSTQTSKQAIEPMSAGSVFDLVSRQDLQAESSVVGRFLYLLSVLARVHKKQFNKVLDIKGRNRLYFGSSAAELNESGSSTNPKQIPNTPYWVITNSNTTRKKMMLTETAIKLGYSEQDAERIRDLL